MKKLRIAVLMHPALIPPDSREGVSEREADLWKTEYDVVSTLRSLGHEVRPVGLYDDLNAVRVLIAEWQPHVFFNLLEEFLGSAEFDFHVVSYLEMKQVPFTGCRPRGLVLARDKALAKKILHYHRIRVPHFAVFPRGRKVRRPRGLDYPLIVKSLTEEASTGISQASIVDSDERLSERVAFIHENVRTDALVEEFIDGRELYVCVLGNKSLTALPIWELVFENLSPGSAAIATARVKHDSEHQRKRGIFQQPAGELPPRVADQIVRTSKRIYRLLQLDGYARLDFRLKGDGELYFLEANPNPEIASTEEFASAAAVAGISYPELLQKIVNLGLKRG
ncbi:MAG TPA: D-alanine--D-alanine ligase [Thermoanaerobaculia bacterium]|nr:D-alanine--D-alanine ligase [Thermoanaerobaculia bacterium]